MKLWISKNSDVPIQEQLTTQLILGIVSADLAASEQLPSSTQIARRFGIHANTVRAAYRDLVERGWLELRAGSGFYVRSLRAKQSLDGSVDVAQLISTFLDIARDRGHSLAEIQTRIEQWFSRQTPDHIVVIEPDVELRKILVAEISAGAPMRVVGIDVDGNSKAIVGGLCVALYDHAADVQRTLPAEAPCLLLHSRSIAKSLAGQSKPGSETIITVISRWNDFLHWARTTLVAVGIEPTAFDIRDAKQKGWDRGLTSRSFIITDTLTARSLTKVCKPRVFALIADESIEQVRKRF